MCQTFSQVSLRVLNSQYSASWVSDLGAKQVLLELLCQLLTQLGTLCLQVITCRTGSALATLLGRLHTHTHTHIYTHLVSTVRHPLPHVHAHMHMREW